MSGGHPSLEEHQYWSLDLSLRPTGVPGGGRGKSCCRHTNTPPRYLPPMCLGWARRVFWSTVSHNSCLTPTVSVHGSHTEPGHCCMKVIQHGGAGRGHRRDQALRSRIVTTWLINWENFLEWGSGRSTPCQHESISSRWQRSVNLVRPPHLTPTMELQVGAWGLCEPTGPHSGYGWMGHL